MKIHRKFATSPDILVAKGKNLVANATVLVALSSPVYNSYTDHTIQTYSCRASVIVTGKRKLSKERKSKCLMSQLTNANDIINLAWHIKLPLE